jgi:peroxiredoxin
MERNLKNNIRLLVILLFLIAGMSCQGKREIQGLRAIPGEKINFTLQDLNGRVFTLDEQKGKPILLIFSTTWCPACRSEIPHFKNIYSVYSPMGLVIINIDIQESQDKVSHFASNNLLPYRITLDKDALVANAYEIRGVPSMILLGKDGRIISREYEQIDGMLAQLFSTN